MSDDLLPCPFCGGVAEQDYQQPYRSISAGKLGKACTICCTGCSANMILCHEDHPGVSPDDLMAELVSAWNRRALPATDAREKALHPDDMLPEAIRLIRQEATRDHSQDVVTGLKHVALLLEQLIGETRT